MSSSGFSRTHDDRMVYPANHPMLPWAHGWTQCDNRGASYQVWLDDADRERSKADLENLELEASKLRTRAQCEAAMQELGISAYGTCKEMRTRYVTTAYADLWPLRQVMRTNF